MCGRCELCPPVAEGARSKCGKPVVDVKSDRSVQPKSVRLEALLARRKIPEPAQPATTGLP